VSRGEAQSLLIFPCIGFVDDATVTTVAGNPARPLG
jgi:hypothetical protein